MNIKSIFLFSCFFSTAVWAKTPLVLLSIDGFAQRYIEQYQPKGLISLIEQGTSAEALLPVYPSKTFPNHLSIITGRYPINHGIVHNSFFNREINKVYKLGDGKNDARWLTAEPLWHINEMQGNKSAVYFWPESETAVDNKKASYFYPYKHSTPNKERLDQILAWLRLPEADRPNFIAGYFATVDDKGHGFGENSPELISAIRDLDQLLAGFMQQINQEFSGQVNVVIVSDHGMTKINPSPVIDWQENIVEGVNVVNGSTQLYLYSDNETKLAQTVRLFKSEQYDQNIHYRVYQYPNYPAHWHLNRMTSSVPNVIIDALPSYIFNDGGAHDSPETHGYDPKLERDLDAIFIAVGPSFSKNKKIAAFDNVNVLPIVTRALGLKDIKNIDGNYQIAEQIVK
jgi:predicted AlkP superfamily pyrophosphatase or phosphodiesterase|tara:strand:- start:14715 stop:15911 length:1197 start_codon:yes stop_codon:yes gene_type:complete